MCAHIDMTITFFSFSAYIVYIHMWYAYVYMFVCVPLSVQFMHLCIKCVWRPEFNTMHLVPHPFS